MSSEIWKICENKSAEDYFKMCKQIGILKSDTIAVNILADACQGMLDAYDEIINDQNEYVIEIDDIITKAENTFNDIQSKIEKLKEEINELRQKADDGTITEEEREELSSKLGELRRLEDLSISSIKQEKNELSSKNNELDSECRSKAKIATDYGKTAVEKGKPLAETEVKGGFFRKLFGSTGKSKKAAGEKAVSVGTNLLNKVKESSGIQDDIDKKLNK